jgi:hypothetical protein
MRHEEKARARYLLERRIPGTNLLVTDAGRWPPRTSAELRAASDRALEVELEASVAMAEKERQA